MDECVDTRARHIGTRTIPQYEIPRREGGPPELLSISLQAGDEKVLPVFSSETLAWASSDAATSVRSSVSDTLTAASWSRCYSGCTRT
jgi:hypothetical protein